jgi:hypothetical protein
MREKIAQTITEARNLAMQKSLGDAESKYLAAIAELEKNQDSVNGKRELWTTQAEYFWFRSQFLTEGETFEECRERKLESIRLVWKAVALGAGFETELRAKATDLVKSTILSVGCIIREDDTHVHIECPIKIRNMGAGQFGFSVGLFYEKATCSICGRDVVKDLDCRHILGEKYDGKACSVKPENLQLDHLAMTTRPKEPDSAITSLLIPRDEVYENFTEEQIRRKTEFCLPFVCSLCGAEGIDPVEITVDKFFEMQGLRMN